MHRIRLSAAWLLESSAETGDSARKRIHLPCAEPVELSGDGNITLVRQFHRPTGLSAQSTTHLVLEVDFAPVAATLNDVAMSALDSAECSADTDAKQRLLLRYDVSGGLDSFNALTVKFQPQGGEQPMVPIHSAWLEIAEPDSDPQSGR